MIFYFEGEKIFVPYFFSSQLYQNRKECINTGANHPSLNLVVFSLL